MRLARRPCSGCNMFSWSANGVSFWVALLTVLSSASVVAGNENKLIAHTCLQRAERAPCLHLRVFFTRKQLTRPPLLVSCLWLLNHKSRQHKYYMKRIFVLRSIKSFWVWWFSNEGLWRTSLRHAQIIWKYIFKCDIIIIIYTLSNIE
jgi:hypothetical protein